MPIRLTRAQRAERKRINDLLEQDDRENAARDAILKPAADEALKTNFARWQNEPHAVTDEIARNPLDALARITSNFGWRDIDNPRASNNHPGVDSIPADGTGAVKVKAAASGTVLLAQEYNTKMGFAVFIIRDNGIVDYYGHLKAGSYAPGIVAGARVDQGDVLAEMGASGNNTFRNKRTGEMESHPCLHYGIWMTDSMMNHALWSQTSTLAAEDPIAAQLVQADVSDGIALNGYKPVQPVIDGRIPKVAPHILHDLCRRRRLTVSVIC